MKNLIAIAIILVAVPASTSAQPWHTGTGPNLVQNPGFEEVQDGRPVGWNTLAAVYNSDETTARTGARSLKYVNDDPERYLLCNQRIDLQPGKLYEVKAWVRTQGIAGEDSGATVCIEWHDADGKWMGGSYFSGRKGDTAEWTEVGGISTRVPEGAAGGTVSCYVRRGMTGTAWWDDVSVRRVRQRPIHTLLVRPSYRGWIDEDTGYAELRVSPVLDDIDGGSDTVRLRVRLTSVDSAEPLAERTVDDLSPNELRVRLPLPELAPGKYRLAAAVLTRATGELIYEDVHQLERRPGRAPKSYVDEHNRLIVDGEPFFPLGMYWSGVNEEELRTFAEGPFNCLMPYGRPDADGMDLCRRMGLKVIYSIKDFYFGTRYCPDFIQSEADEERVVREYVRRFRDHPALLAWYINDERPLSLLSRLEAHQRWVEEEDPDHPSWVVLYQVGDVALYARTFDAIGTDPYPIPGRPASMAGQWARQTREAVDNARAIWMVPQVFNKASYRSTPEEQRDMRPPTFDEMRSMTWQCITEGANGIIFYSWFDMRRDKAYPFEQRWPQVKRVAQEVADMIPVLLSVEPTPDLEIDAPESVHWTTRSHDGSVYLFLVNDSEEKARAAIRFPKPVRSLELAGNRVPVSNRRTLDVLLDPLGVKIYRVRMSPEYPE